MTRSISVACGAAALLAASLLAGTTASAVTPKPSAPLTVAGSTPSHRVHFFPTPTTHSKVHGSADERQGSPPLVNGGGPIMKREASYAIFWDPGHLQDGSATKGITKKYKRLIKRYFTDINRSGLYKNNRQYASQGQRPTSTRFAATWMDNTPFPKNHCNTPDTGTNCVTDADIVARVIADAGAHGITKSTSKMFFVFTPQDEGSCFDAGCQFPSYSYYCAYHGNIPNAGGDLIYANMPFPTVSDGNNCYYPPGQVQQFPNNVNADAAINVTSHEQIEAVTDPLINAWTDAAGYEIGDECAWDFGSTLGNGGDVTLNGNPYGLQKEASNASANCVLSGP